MVILLNPENSVAPKTNDSTKVQTKESSMQRNKATIEARTILKN